MSRFPELKFEHSSRAKNTSLYAREKVKEARQMILPASLLPQVAQFSDKKDLLSPWFLPQRKENLSECPASPAVQEDDKEVHFTQHHPEFRVIIVKYNSR